MRRYPTRDEIIQWEDDQNWTKEATKEQPVSDTLLEPEDQMSDDDGSKDWCDDCHGYVHAPWCPAYKEPDTRRSGEMGHRTNHEQPASSHQPAARGEGDGDKWSIKIHGNEIDADLLVNGSYVGTLHSDKAKQILVEHNQHQSLVAERERLRRMLANVIDANYGTSYHHIGDGDGMPADEAKEIADWWKAELERIQREYDEQRSTSE